MRRRVAYAFLGGFLSAGAPAGLLALRLASRRRYVRDWLKQASSEIAADRVGYSYVAVSTAVVFGLFGYLLGRGADRLGALAATDALTGLSNARGLFDRIDLELARWRRYRAPLSLLLVDLDGLKAINDRDGHHAGDEAIRRLARVIRAELRESDTGARWGGDEFAVLAPNTSTTAAASLAERIRGLVAGDAEGALSASVGVTTVQPGEDEHSVDSATLMRAADAALYEAKRQGRNRVAVASLYGKAHAGDERLSAP